MLFGQCGIHVITNNCSLVFINSTRLIERNASTMPFPSGPGKFDFQKVVELYLTSILILLGIFGNITSIIVLRKDRERKNALFLLQALALADGCYLIVAIFRYPLKYLLPSQEKFIAIQPIVFPLLKTFQTVTIWMIVIVTIDRYTCVCRPLLAPCLFNQKTRRGYTLALFVTGFVYNIPRFLDSCVYQWKDPCTGTVVSRMSYRESFSGPYYYNIYIDIMYIVLLYVIPLSTLIFMNCRLVQAIRNSHAQRYRDSCIASATSRPPNSHSSSGSLLSGHSDKNATTVLIIIVIVFIVCETPELVQKFVSFTERNFSYSDLLSREVIRFNIVSQLLMVINSSINFFIYLIFGRRFRRILKETFRFSFHFGSQSTSSSYDGTPAALKFHHNCIHTRK